MSTLDDIAGISGRLDTADDMAGLLAVSWEAFDLVVAVCQRCQDGSHELFATFAFAAAAAAEGRGILSTAPSLAAGRGEVTDRGCFQNGTEAVADAMASLAGSLRDRLAVAGGEVNDPGDRGACADAALQAALVGELLAPGA